MQDYAAIPSKNHVHHQHTYGFLGGTVISSKSQQMAFSFKENAILTMLVGIHRIRNCYSFEVSQLLERCDVGSALLSAFQ
jgi:hypothetical protein